MNLPDASKVQVYRLWPDKTWDLVDVLVPDEPWTVEIVESRAVTQAWLEVSRLPNDKKPLQIGLYMHSFQEASL